MSRWVACSDKIKKAWEETLIMKVTFGAQNAKVNVFSDIAQHSVSNHNPAKLAQKPDTFELKNIKQKILKNKKLVIGALIAGAALTVGIVYRKNIASLFKKTQKAAEPKGITESLIDNAKSFLIDDVKKNGEASANGICFYGPDSIGKEKYISDFIQDLSNAGYQIEQAPRASEASVQTIGDKIGTMISEAKERFGASGKRTAIIVRDLDKIALDRRDGNDPSVVRALLETQNARKQGFAWIAEAVDPSKVDTAIRRTGRMEHNIITRPAFEDTKEVWSEYIELIKRLRDGEFKGRLFKEAESIVKKKGI